MAHYHNGYAFKPTDWSNDGIRIIRIEQLNNPEGNYDKYDGVFPSVNAINDGDLIFSWSATLKVAIWKHGEAVLNQHLFRVDEKQWFSKKFIYYVLDANMESLGGGSHGSTMKHIKRGELAKFMVTVPPLPIQQKIATILSTLDRTIEKTEELIAKYRKIKTGLMHDLFTRGIGADGKLRPPRDQAPELYKQSPIGWIPKEWEVKDIGTLFHIQLGKMLNKEAKTGRWSASYLGNKNVKWESVDLANLETMDFSPDERKKFCLLPGDLLVCEGGEVGRTAIWRGELIDCFYQKAIHRLRPSSGRIKPEYMLRFMRYAKNSGFLTDFTSQTSIAHLTQEKLSRVNMYVPLMQEQTLIIEKFESLDRKLRKELNGLQKLQKQKSGLMHDLLTGKVQVSINEDEAVHV
jgi:type I restriction enzyme S subunit